jgi:hypothetical protein
MVFFVYIKVVIVVFIGKIVGLLHLLHFLIKVLSGDNSDN